MIEYAMSTALGMADRKCHQHISLENAMKMHSTVEIENAMRQRLRQRLTLSTIENAISTALGMADRSTIENAMSTALGIGLDRG